MVIIAWLVLDLHPVVLRAAQSQADGKGNWSFLRSSDGDMFEPELSLRAVRCIETMHHGDGIGGGIRPTLEEGGRG